MKTTIVSILLSLNLITACNQGGDGGTVDMGPLPTMHKLWTPYGFHRPFIFTSIDTTNLASVVVTGMFKNGVTSDCTYATTFDQPDQWTGMYTITGLTSGDPDVCGQLDDKIGISGYEDRNSGHIAAHAFGSLIR